MPKGKKVLWVEINKLNVTKTRKGWKLSIPIANELNGKSKKAINRIILKSKTNITRLSQNEKTKIADVEHIKFVTESIQVMSNYTDIYTSNIKTAIEQVAAQSKYENVLDRALGYQTIVNNVSTISESLASRIYNEVQIFSTLFSRTIHALKYNFLLLNASGQRKSVINDYNSLEFMSSKFIYAIHGMTLMRNSVIGLNKDNLFDNDAIQKAEIALSTLVEELKIAKELIDELLVKIKRTITEI